MPLTGHTLVQTYRIWHAKIKSCGIKLEQFTMNITYNNWLSLSFVYPHASSVKRLRDGMKGTRKMCPSCDCNITVECLEFHLTNTLVEIDRFQLRTTLNCNLGIPCPSECWKAVHSARARGRVVLGKSDVNGCTQVFQPYTHLQL